MPDFPLPKPLHHSGQLLTGLTIIAALLTAPAVGAETSDAIDKVVSPMVSPHDERDYRALTLDNGLSALLVSDPEADKAAASLNVSVGSAQDPADLAGLAHFLEHMLFLGTEKYPESDAYQSYLSRHGGNHNAFTAPYDTNYFFEIEPDVLAGALDRFSRFFIDPLFNADRLESERNVVHSEYQARLRDEQRRRQDVLDQLLNPDHPATGFSVGSLETLADRPPGEPTLRERVISFYEAHYGANVMHLAVVAPQSLDEIEAMVTTHFAPIADRGLSRPVTDTPLVEKETLPSAAALHSLRESHQVTFLFPVPDPETAYRHKPGSYLANLLGHEGEGSLLAILREAGWADGLSAGVGRGDGRHGLFTVDISLTPEGAEQIERIQSSLFAAIEKIRESGLEEWRYAEQARLAEQEFRFQQHGAPTRDAMRLAMNLARYPLKDVNYAPYRMDGFDRQQIERWLDNLRPQQMLRLYSGPQVEGRRTSPWFHAAWREVEPAVDAMPEPLAGLALPDPNPFIAEDLSLLDKHDESPEKRLDEEGFAFWHKADTSFDTPRVEWRFSLQHPATSRSARETALARLLAGWLEDSLNEALYPARLAGHDFRAQAHARGITLSFSGWRDRQDRLIARVMSQLQEEEIATETFARVQHRLERDWRNEPRDDLHRQAYRTLSEALIHPQWSSESLLEASSDLDVEDLRDFRQSFLDELRLEAMAVGNLGEELAIEEARMVAAALSPRLAEDAIARLVPLQVPDELPTLTPDSTREESVVLRYLQGPDRSLQSQARLAVLGRLLETPFYQRLRTEEQLGYVVNAAYSPLLDAPGIRLLVQSPDTRSETIQAHIDDFLEEFDSRIEALSDDALTPYRRAVHDEWSQRDTSLSQRAERLWQAIALGNAFDRRERLAEHALAVTADDLREAWSSLRGDSVASITFDPGDEASDLEELRGQLEPLPEGEQ